MKITVDRSELQDVLALANRFVDRVSTIPVLTQFLLTAIKTDSGGELRIAATNLEIGFVRFMPAKVEEAGTATVPAKRFADYIRLSESDGIAIEASGAKCRVTAGTAQAMFGGFGGDSYPEIPDLPDARLPILPAANGPANFARMCSRIIRSVSVEESCFTLQGALIEIGGGILRMVSTDGHRLTICEAPSLPEAKARVLVTRDILACIAGEARDQDDGADYDDGEFEEAVQGAIETGKMPTKTITRESGSPLCPIPVLTFATADTHQFFGIDGGYLFSRTLTGKFPDYERLLKTIQPPHSVSLDPARLIAALERCKLAADERSALVNLRLLTSGKLKLSSKNGEHEAGDVLPVSYSGPHVEAGFNANYLLDFLRVAGPNEFTLSLKDNHTACIMRAPAPKGHRYDYVVMPMRT